MGIRILTVQDFENVQAGLEKVAASVDKLSSNPNHIILTNKQAQELFQVSSKTLQKWRDEGYLGYSRIGREIFYRMSHIQEMLDRFYVEPRK